MFSIVFSYKFHYLPLKIRPKINQNQFMLWVNIESFFPMMLAHFKSF